MVARVVVVVVPERAVFRVRTDTDIKESVLDPWAAYRVALIGAAAVVVAGRLFLRNTARIGSILRGSIGVMGAYCCFCLASTLWSSYPAWTLYKSLEYCVDVALLAAILVVVPSVRATDPCSIGHTFCSDFSLPLCGSGGYITRQAFFRRLACYPCSCMV